MIIDFHTHTYPDKIAAKTVELLAGRSGTVPHSDGTLMGLESDMEHRRVDISVVLPVATSPKQYKHINESAQVENEQFADTHVWSFGGIHPDNDNYKEILRDISDKGLKGIKLHPDYQGAFFNDIRYKRIISYATELGLIVVTHAGQDIGLPEAIALNISESISFHLCTAPSLYCICPYENAVSRYTSLPHSLSKTSCHICHPPIWARTSLSG